MVVAVVVVVAAVAAVAVAAMGGFLQCSFLFQFFVSSSSLLSSLPSIFFFLLGAVVRIFVHKKGHLAERCFMNVGHVFVGRHRPLLWLLWLLRLWLWWLLLKGRGKIGGETKGF